MGTSYLGAAMKGIGDGGTVLSRSMIEAEDRKQRWDEQQRNQLALEDARQRGRLESIEARQIGVGGMRGGSRGGGGAGIMDISTGQGEELMAAQMGMNLPEYRKFTEMERTGSDKAYRTEFTSYDDEYGEQKGSALPPEFEEFKKQKRAERGKLMETYSYSDDIEKIAKSRGVDSETALIEKAATGDRKAGEGILYAKGKDPRETDAKAKKAEAEAKDEEASAALRARTDPNARKSGGSGGGGGGGGDRVQSTKVDGEGNIILVMRDGTIKQTGTRASSFNADVSRIIAGMDKDYNFKKLSPEEKRSAAIERLVGSPPPPPAAAAAPAGQRYPDGTRVKDKSGKVYVIRGGVPVPE